MARPSFARAALSALALVCAGCANREVAASDDSRLPVEPVGEWRLEKRPFLTETRAVISKELRKIEQPRNLCVGPFGFTYVADGATRSVWKLDAHGRAAFVFAVTGESGALAVDHGGAIYVADERAGAVRIFLPDGTPLRTLRGGSARRLLAPAGVAVDGYGNIFVVERGAHRVQKFNSRGRFVTAWGKRGAGTGELESPSGIAVSPDGYVYVADAGNHRVQKFTADGEAVGWFGSAGSGPAQIGELAGIAASESHVAIADAGNRRVQLWSAHGVHRYDVVLEPQAASAAPAEASRAPTAVALTDRRELLVLDPAGEYPRILRFRLNLE